MDSSSVESPLDVLSRAATMLRQRQADRACKPRSTVGKDVQASARWRRERRPCPLVSSSTVPSRPIARPAPRSAQHVAEMAPLDMSTRRKEPTPATTILPRQKTHQAPRRSQPTPRVSVITCAPATSPSASSSEEECVLGLESDPVIDEHFRRSLGRDYLALFPAAASHSSPRTSSPPPAPSRRPNSSSQQSSMPSSVTLTGLSVDDHFAKALGETWLRLQAGEKKAEEKSKSNKSSPSSTSEDHAPSSPATVIPLRVST